MKAGISLAFIGPNKLLQRKTPPSIFPGIRCFRGGGASAEHSRYRTERSSAFLAGWKSPPGKGQPPSRTESWVRGGAAGRRRTRRAKRRQGVPWAVGAARAPKCWYSFEMSVLRTPRVLTNTEGNTRDPRNGERVEGPPESSGCSMWEERCRRTREAPGGSRRGDSTRRKSRY